MNDSTVPIDGEVGDSAKQMVNPLSNWTWQRGGCKVRRS